MESGITALLSLDGSPLDPADCAALGLSTDEGDNTVAIAAHDTILGQAVISRAQTRQGFALLVGKLSDPADVARLFNMATDTPPALLVHRARQERGKDMALLLDGEWSYLEWNAEDRQAVVAASMTIRDPLFFAADGNTVAMAPRMMKLARLPWVDSSFDTLGLCLHLAKARLRELLSHQTPISGVTRLPPGGVEVFGSERRSERCSAPELPRRWQGTFDDAIEAFDAELRRILKFHMEGHRRVALMLSGGLDSSAIAYYASAALDAGQSLAAITSTAPPGSDVEDEAGLAARVAERLGLPLLPVQPDPAASVFIPSDSLFDKGEIPAVSPRHYLYETIHARAAEEDVTLLLDGCYGEGSISYRLPLLPALPRPLGWARQMAGNMVRAVRQRQMQSFDWQFHPFLSAGVLAELAAMDEISKVRGRPKRHRLRPDQQFGYIPAMSKNTMTPTASPFGPARHTYPMRERSLLRLMAAMPAGFIEHGGSDRAIVRNLLAGKVPDEIVLKNKAGSFSPDFDNRIRAHASHILDALPLWRRSIAADWLDLDRMEQGAQKLSGGIAIPPPERFQLQTTSCAAAYFHWAERQLAGRTV